MKRTAFQSNCAHDPLAETRIEPRKCKHCRKRTEGPALHDECVGAWWEANREKVKAMAERAKAKVERAHLKQRKAALLRIPDLIALAQKDFNAYIRERDKDQPCICCGRTKTAVDGLGSHGWDAGHYRSTGSAPHHRFNENNCHRQLVYCNRHGAGRAVDYRIGLIARIGLAAVEALESDNAIHRWTREELISVRDEYKRKLKTLKAKND